MKIEVLLVGEFPEEDEGIHMKLLPFSFTIGTAILAPLCPGSPKKRDKNMG